MSTKAGRDEAGEESTPKKRFKMRSEVWEHFTKINDGTRANCKYCNKKFSLKWGTTTHLNRHLGSCKKVPHGGIPQPLTIAENNERAAIDLPPTASSEDAVRNFGVTQEPPTITSEGEIWNFSFIGEHPTTVFEGVARNSCFTQEANREIHVKNAILADFPFLSPNVRKAWSSPMGMDMEKEICAYYERERDKLRTEFGSLTSRVCFSIEVMKEAGWMSITAHFIDSDFNLVKKLIGFKKLPDISSNLFDESTNIIDRCISEWKLENKIFSFTGSRYLCMSWIQKFDSKMVLEDWDDMLLSCLRRLVGEVYFDSIDTLQDAKNKITKFVEEVMKNPSKMMRFYEIAKEKGLSLINVDWLRGQPMGWDAYAATNCSCKFSRQVVKMFKDALLYKEVFAQCARTKIDDYLELSSERPFTEIDIEDIDWSELETAINQFEAVKSIIDQLSNFKYPTSNLRFQAEIKAEELLDADITNARQHTFYVACILDPRYKLTFLKYYFKQQFNDVFWHRKVDIIRNFFKKLLRAYAGEQTNEVTIESPRTARENRLETINKFPVFIKERKTSGIVEMEQYLGEETVDIGDTHFNVLNWWRENRSCYPVLSRMARDVLAIPACAYSVEEDLKFDLNVLQGVSPEFAEAVICSKDWILSDIPSPGEYFHKSNEQRPSTFATANDSGERTGNRDTAQPNSSVEIPRDTSPNAPCPNKISEAVISISGNSQETDIPQPTLQKQPSENAPDEDEEKTKAAMQQVREKNRGKFFNWVNYGLGLNFEEFLAVEFLEEIEPTVIIVKMEADPDNPIRLTRKHMNSLLSYFYKDDEERWIANQVIDAYINIINHERDPSCNKPLIVSTLDTRLLRDEGKRKKCKTNSKIRELGMKFLKNDLIFFPINMGGVHWIVGVLNISKLEFQILDSRVMSYNSVSPSTYDFLPCELCPGITDCIDSVRGSSEAMKARANQFDVAMRKINVIKTVPQQTDQSSCGLFAALRYIQFWNGSDIPNMLVFPTWEMDVFRRKVAAELIMSELNLMKVVQQEIKQLADEVVW